MSILINKNTRLVVSGMTGREGSFHTRQMIEYGTNVVAGVTPGKGGIQFEAGDKTIPVFDTIKEAVDQTSANTSMIIVPARFCGGCDLRGSRCGHFPHRLPDRVYSRSGHDRRTHLSRCERHSSGWS